MKQCIQKLVPVVALLLGLAAHTNPALDGDAPKGQDGGSGAIPEHPYGPDYPYQSLADVPERYRDGEELIGCFVHDSRGGQPSADFSVNLWDPPEYPPRIECKNPFYWDKRGFLRNIQRPNYLPPGPFPLGGSQGVLPGALRGLP